MPLVIDNYIQLGDNTKYALLSGYHFEFSSNCQLISVSDKRRSEEEIKEMDAKNKITSDMVCCSNRKRRLSKVGDIS